MKGALASGPSTESSSASKSCVCCYSYNAHIPGTVPTPCCKRFVCGQCIKKTPRFAHLCILCQLPLVGDVASEAPPSPPAYDVAGLPSYHATEVSAGASNAPIGSEKVGHSVQHYVRKEDTVQSLSLAYQISAGALRAANNLFADHLLQARSFIVVPGARVSLSSAPAEDDARKVKLHKFMVASKCTDYAMGQAYMTECEQDVQAAVERYNADSRWTREQHKKH